MLKRTNVESRLQAIREREWQDSQLSGLLQALQIQQSGRAVPTDLPIAESGDNDRDGRPGNPPNTFDFDLLETRRIYRLDQIRAVCIDYRLRFLDLKYFKPELPESARQAIADLENAHDTRLEGLKIIAPSRLFKLQDRDDPLLFVPLGNDYFYLVHKWGNDLHPLRRLLVWPFRNIANLTLVVLLVSYLVSLLVPGGLFSKNDSAAEFWIIFFFMFKSLAAVVIFYGFALGKNFNPAIWNSKYFNA
ncbi:MULTISPECIES: hypothetical protein [Robiginitalea]|uniref:Uncharacterized protein n=1 Tax=Robiginitalea biformata (strain ATCC BAA-864 / DSM 15991 / KCTC 12146 / HTCC2501) TaxID=313596 RepID=A4CLR1_ROBBH|nr:MULTISPECIES: hypothetical protein [Robiginitalea]EAR15810.1 hypothetical protein RB2501_15819 [Robiginitalea biformata HTCC2501]MDC6354234.1 hypothetical protein [Robiginitalea sp. PM2]MDC6374501.1 hypothetical protein [Robiginitalea sp. SP8]